MKDEPKYLWPEASYVHTVGHINIRTFDLSFFFGGGGGERVKRINLLGGG